MSAPYIPLTNLPPADSRTATDNGNSVDTVLRELPFLTLLQLATKGDAVSQTWIGVYYSIGTVAVGKDQKKAVEWYQKAAAQNEPYAQRNLGFCYYTGHGVEIDFEKAVKFFKSSIEIPMSKSYLGTCYYNGKGVKEKNYTEAARLFMQSSELRKSQRYLGACYLYGHGVQQDKNEAMTWFQKATKQGDKIAQNILSKLDNNLPAPAIDSSSCCCLLV